jgi:hypothetical protein
MDWLVISWLDTWIGLVKDQLEEGKNSLHVFKDLSWFINMVDLICLF